MTNMPLPQDKRSYWMLPFLLVMSIPAAQANKVEPVPWYEYKPLHGSYMIYGGDLGDTWEPKPGDAKIAFSMEGSAAKAIFEQLGRDVKDECTAGMGIRIRRRDHLECSRENTGEYRCNFGFDIKTGKSIGGVIC